jgi:hypothetical protein
VWLARAGGLLNDNKWLEMQMAARWKMEQQQ